jgi:hypothetical protein
MKNRLYLLTALVTAILTLISCTSRYTIDLYLVSGEKKIVAKVEQTQFAAMTILASPYADAKIVQGTGNTLMIGTGSRGEREGKLTQYDVLTFDEYVRYRIFLQLPMVVKKGSTPLTGNAFVERLERYDQPHEENIYMPESGNFIVDSLVSKYMYATFENGYFANSKGSKVAFQGKIRVKVAD